MLELHLFGPGQGCYAESPLTAFPSQQYYRLLCYLLLNRGRPHYRERLAAIFWGEYSTSASRTYLRSALWRLRQALQSAGVPVDEYLAVNDNSVSFLTSGRYWLDVEAFEAAVGCCQETPEEDLTSEQAVRLESAVDLYAGDLLEGIYDDWCLYDRERLRIHYLDVLGTLLVFHELNGTHERGLMYGKRILASDPTRERAHRQIMRLYWFLGERSEALAQYQCCSQMLSEELGVSPMASTTLLYRQMVSNQFDPAGWREHGSVQRSEPYKHEESIRAIARDALDKLRRLQAMTEETAVELGQIEHLIHKALGITRPKEPTPPV